MINIFSGKIAIKNEILDKYLPFKAGQNNYSYIMIITTIG